MFVPSLFSGLSFPLLFNGIKETNLGSGRRVGHALAINTFGCISGAMLTGFILLPALGMQVTLLAVTFLSLCMGLLVITCLATGIPQRIKASAVILCLLIWGLLVTVSGVRLPSDYLANGRELIDFVEGKSTFIAVIKRNNNIKMELDRMWQGQQAKGHQIMAAHLPMLLHPSAKEILVVGVGAGQAPSRFLYHNISRLDCVDLEDRIPPVLKKHFQADWLDDPRTRFIAEDGATYIRNINRKYDLISIEVGQVFRPQASPFYHTEFYQKTRQRLATNGIVVQFLPVGFFTEPHLKSVIKTFISQFPNSTLWYNDYAELLLIGSPDRKLAFNHDSIAALRGNLRVFADLFWGLPGTEEFFLNRPEVLAASFLMGAKTLTEMSKDAEILSDDKPILEYGTARTSYRPQRFKRLFEELHESPQEVIAFTTSLRAVQKATRLQHQYIRNGFD